MKHTVYKLIGMFLLIALSSIGAMAQELQLDGYVRTYIGVLLEEKNDFSIVQNSFDLNFGLSMERTAFEINPFIYQQPGQELNIGLREAYMDIYLRSLDIRLGKQQIIWGKAEGVFITDIVSPKDLREFLLPDFDEIRIGVTALKADYYIGYHTFEVAWVPVFIPTEQPEYGSIWAVTPSFPVPVVINPSEEVATRLGNSELFGKYSFLGSLIDFELMAGYFWDDDPALHVTDRTFSGPDLTSITITPRHQRLGLVGGSFSAAPAGFVIRGEGGYNFGKFFPTTEPSYVDGVSEKNFIHYAVGIDFSLLDITMSAQYIQKVILDYDDMVVNDRFDNLMTFLMKKDFMHETLHAELFAYIGFNNTDALLRPEIGYDIADGFEIQFGSNIFLGDEGQFGQYDDNDMIFVKAIYSF